MRIIKFNEFINEELMNDTPESYVEIALKQIKKKIDKMFDFQEGENDEETGEISIKKARINSKNKDIVSLKDLGIKLESSEISKYSKMYDNLTIKFSDPDAWYNLFIAIDVKDAIPKEEDKDFSYKDIEKCFVKFKKYDLNTNDVIGQITKNVDIKSIDDNFLIDLKLEMDEEFGDEEEFEIETE